MEEESRGVVPDALLAFAKDHRYVEQCRRLLQQVVGDEDDSDVSLWWWWWWSALLYATLVVRHRGRTLGMEFVGLKHTEVTTWQRRLGTLVLTAGWALWFRQCTRLESAHRLEQRHEALRGEARRHFFNQQRLAMMQRASLQTPQSASAPLQSSSSNRAERPSSDEQMDAMKRIRQSVVRFSEIMSNAIVSFSDSPHTLPSTGTLILIGRWILRLHLAHYCLTGRYPTLLHRLLRLRIDEGKESSKSRLSDPPPTTHSLVGKLIYMQAIATLSQSLARWYASYRASKRRRSVQHENPSDTDAGALHHTSSSSSLQPCAICRTPRSQSAAPSGCGHVFCWNCLYQWVSTVRPECPLCRTACRPQDVIAIYNYAPSTL